ncbi:MAG: SurA N-terminal domain-containing protein, partial [Ghiorsea sp.]
MNRLWVSCLLSMLVASSAFAERLDAIAAVVNGQAVTCYEVDLAEQALRGQLRQQQGGQAANAALPSGDELYERALDSRVMRALQQQEAQLLDIKISAAEINAAIADVEKRNKLQVGQLVEVLQAQGVDMGTYRDNLKDRLLNNRLMSLAVRAKLSVTEESMREYYRKHLQNPQAVREVRISQLFVSLPAEAGAKAVEKSRKKAAVYYKKLMQGSGFSRMVSLKSDAPNAADGGDMGWVSPGAVSG